VVAFARLDSFLFEPPANLGTLLLAHPHRCVTARSSSRVEREPRVAEICHDRMAFRLDDPGCKDSLVELGEPIGIVRLEGDVIDPCHPADGL
jgi:hypothetical protein